MKNLRTDALDKCVPVEMEALCDPLAPQTIPPHIYVHHYAGCIQPLARGHLQVETLVIGMGVTEIAPYAFAGFVKLREVYMPETLRKIGQGAFLGCVRLEHIHLPHVLGEETSIGRYQTKEAPPMITEQDLVDSYKAFDCDFRKNPDPPYTQEVAEKLALSNELLCRFLLQDPPNKEGWRKILRGAETLLRRVLNHVIRED